MKITAENVREHMQTHTKGNSWWMEDAKGIPLSRVCEACVEVVKRRYKPEVLGLRGNYEDAVEEPIEPQD
jgi:hypothetical protein